MIIKQAAEVLKIEAESILNLIPRLDDQFIRMVELIAHAKGRVIIAGIGKSGLIGRKIAATLNSTGTHAFFLHPVEAMHGDLGMVCQGDIFIALSNSGETDELNILLPSIKAIGCPIIAFTGKKDSTLSSFADLIIDVGVEKEACPMGLAPTSSTTALLAMGDALSVVLITMKQFKSTDFKKFHPGGRLGQRLSCNVEELMLKRDRTPLSPETATLGQAIDVMDRMRLGVVLVAGPGNQLKGILTDGDVRHLIAMKKMDASQPVSRFMTRNPKQVQAGTPVYDALNLMETKQITVLPVMDSNNIILGVLHLHDILGKGQFKFNGSTTVAV
ncbi:MAG: KpsF/GutQ family sugar-phosphate isomerase [Proteobacteria bacterium]|nr:KpsF/GutQ family sugar-phosphate isomerase [Pseudomonadota bacterium]